MPVAARKRRVSVRGLIAPLPREVVDGDALGEVLEAPFEQRVDGVAAWPAAIGVSTYCA